jgi:hypothetical protein
MSGPDSRLDRLSALLEREGVTGASCTAAGAQCDIAVVDGVEPLRLASLAPAIRALGFRFVAIELDCGPC